jgi:bifunctional ADP-heptose synthase (sugar kinase/adenylyltransferase)
VDWYDGEHIVRAMDEAKRRNIPVFINLEHGHKKADLLKKYAERATFCQAVTDAAQIGGKQALLGTARKLLKSGIRTAIITLAKGGCLVAHGEEIVRVFAPRVKAVDACGAGATFSAGFLYGYLKDWTLESCARFATAAATLKVTRAGLEMYPVEQIMGLAQVLNVERWRFRNDKFEIIERILSIPDEVAKRGKSAQERFLREIRFPRKKKNDEVQHPHVKPKRKII